jgi:4-hydroxy-tetrahydrodipicolinate synthase
MLSGVYTALVTPFNEDGDVDYDTFRRLIERQIEGGVQGILPMGSTGESPTLDHDEHSRVIDAAIGTAAGRVTVMAGTGSNSTREAVELTRHAKESGADATLQITPYYNKPNQEGLVRHFSAVADLGLPVVLYNIPGRTGREIEIDTVARLAEHPHIVAIKESGGSVDRVSQIRNACDLTILSGDDPLTLPMMSVGAKGVVSVATNLTPEPVVELVSAALAGDFAKAREFHERYYRFFCDLFIDVNPIPVKAAMAMLGLAREDCRLPLCPLDDAKKQRLRQTLADVGLV